MKIYISTDAEILDLVEVVQQYLAQAGLQADIVQLDWSAYKQALNKGEADAFWLSWWADYPDPENFLYPMFHSANWGPAGNRTWFGNRDVDRLVERSQSAIDERERYTGCTGRSMTGSFSSRRGYSRGIGRTSMRCSPGSVTSGST